ncbi:hypothetical protein LEP1GSC086_0680 [Leptospira weilii str. LNT 1234]|nr:hypothetical protein LEP1GSC086_0680 [Leptospira weilii str. LNT 1234]
MSQNLTFGFLKFISHNISSGSGPFYKHKSCFLKHCRQTRKSITGRFFSTGYASKSFQLFLSTSFMITFLFLS